MQPTKGRIRTRGRVSALIEVGAGFHPEMTGRENIYLNGSILGMTRREIDSKLDAIVAFAELERFIDTPVKRYSSGMYARLGFAVAAHVDPEILLVDEVLSVGDEVFQIKCQQHMSGLMSSGVTVLFVSHNLLAVTVLCERSVVLNHGQIAFAGDSSDAVRALRRLQSTRETKDDETDLGDLRPVYIEGIRILDGSGNATEEIDSGDALVIEVSGVANNDIEGLNIGIDISRVDGVRCYNINSRMDGYLPDVERGSFVVRFAIPRCDLLDGVYFVSASFMDRLEHVHYHIWARCGNFSVRESTGYRGVARLGHEWATEPASAIRQVP
jgi:lipopolysaccharide transport system ATP-binding protein